MVPLSIFDDANDDGCDWLGMSVLIFPFFEEAFVLLLALPLILALPFGDDPKKFRMSIVDCYCYCYC